jgi:hypothetical protein
MESRLSETIREANSTLTAIVSGEIDYWTGKDRAAPVVSGIEP